MTTDQTIPAASSRGRHEDRPVVVTGATGRQGGATARRLLAAGRPVRALVRDPDAPAARELKDSGAEIVRGDFDEPSGLRGALEGASALFAVPPAVIGPSGIDVEREFRRGRALVDAAVEAGIEQVVFTGVASTGGEVSGPGSGSRLAPADGTGGQDGSRGPAATRGKQGIERFLRERIPQVTVVRPARFMTNYLASPAPGIDGIVAGVHRHIFPPDEPCQIIALEDIAEFAALAFDDPDRFAGRTLELAGDAPTPAAAAAAISEATGIAVRYEQLTHDEAAALSPEVALARERWAAGARWHADIEALRVIHPGLRTLKDWLEESGAAALRSRLLRDAV